MRLRTLPIFLLLAACGGGTASLASGPASAAESQSLECALGFMRSRYEPAGGGVSAGFIYFRPYKQDGAMRRAPRPDTLLVTVRSNDGVLSTEGPVVPHMQADLRNMLTTCSAPAAATATASEASR
jgi:hypothetical protein